MTVCDDRRELNDENSLNVIHINRLCEEPVGEDEDVITSLFLLSSHVSHDHSYSVAQVVSIYNSVKTVLLVYGSISNSV